MSSVVEDAGTFRGNALIKARALASKAPRDWVLADDSGLSVDALNGAPGVESAYYAGPQGDPRANLDKLVREMAPVPAARRGAHFTCVLCLRGPDGSEQFFEGTCAGRLLGAPRGGAGFGYDPLFLPEGHEETFAEMGEELKNRISHRGRAWARLAASLKS